MRTYAPASALGWLDLDAAASERAAVLLRAFEEPGTLDPLGLGAVRDAFSEVIAPGTSTIQTRLRYFLFIPWICQRIERDGVAALDFPGRLRADEARLITCLRHLGQNQGVQGFNSGAALRRMPSEAYWGGLGRWGIRRLDLSIREYGRRIGEVGRRRVELDDDRNPISASPSMWAPVPGPPDGFLAGDIAFDLAADEAVFLVDQIRRTCAGSVLAEACRFPGEAADADLPWDLPAHRVSPSLVETLHHARCVSELTLGAQHVYNLLLARRAAAELGWEVSGVTDAVEADLAEWVASIEERSDVLRAWVEDLEGFWGHLARFGSVPAATVAFVSEMVRRASADPEEFIVDPVAHQWIRDREIRLKGTRARLGPRAALETWNQARFGGPLVYRWPIARSYLRDLAGALEAGS